MPSSTRPSSARATCAGRTEPAGGFELLDHPGDVKLRAWGANLQELFVNAARGMMNYLFGGDIADLQPARTETITIEAPDRESLLVDWLSELLYRATSGYCVFVAFQIQELGDTQLKAAAGVVAAAAIEDIKAVTHHELSIREEDRGWEATVVFDI